MENVQQSAYPDLAQRLSTLLNSSEIQLVPYIQYEGQWTVPDSALLSMFDRLKEEGTYNRVFYDDRIQTGYDFIGLMKRESTFPIFAFNGITPVLFAWLNDLRGNYGFTHFSGFHPWGRFTLKSGEMVLRYWREILPNMQVILGMIPSTNRLAIRFGKRLGFIEVGEIPYVIGGKAAVLMYYEVQHATSTSAASGC